MDNGTVIAALSQAYPQLVVSSSQSLGQLHVSLDLKEDEFLSFMRFLRDDQKLTYTLLSDITAVDWTPRTPRFDLVYILYSVLNEHRLIVHLPVPDDHPVPSVSGIWHSADWGEREVYDLMGISFTNHPDLRRILTWDTFEGHPLRKEYPVCGWHDVNNFDFQTMQVYSAFSLDQDEPCEIQNTLE